MPSSIKYRTHLIILSSFLLSLLAGCATKGNVGDPAATERALIASLTALAQTGNNPIAVVETAEPPLDGPGSGNAAIQFRSFEVENNFPDSITFKVVATSELPLRSAAFYYWRQGQDSRTLEMVPFSSGDEITASYTWDTDRITVAPSTPIYFNWELEDESGNLSVSEEMLTYYDDLRFDWNEIRDDELIVRWYEGDSDFGGFVFSTTRDSLDQMKAATGMDLEFPIIVLLYTNMNDFASWHFYVEDWVGGQAFTPLGITTQIINSRDSSAWITNVIPHEIAHLFFYQQISTNFASWPSWMDEGFAQYFEFNTKNSALNRVERAALDGTLIPLRYLNGSFGPDTEDVYQSYDQSLSVIVFLLERWGEAGLEALLDEIRKGATISNALSGAFGVTFEEFEAHWITWLGAPATPRPSPTMVPTFGVIGMQTQSPGGTATPSP